MLTVPLSPPPPPLIRQDLGTVEVLGWEAPAEGSTDDRLLVTHGRSSACDGAVLALDTLPSGPAAGGDADMDAVRAVTGSSDGRYGRDSLQVQGQPDAGTTRVTEFGNMRPGRADGTMMGPARS